MLQRGFNFVRQFSQSEPERKTEPESENLAREMVESLLDDYDEDDLQSESDSAYDMDFGPIGTPKHCGSKADSEFRDIHLSQLWIDHFRHLLLVELV